MSATTPYDIATARTHIVGLNTPLPRREGLPAAGINLDNADES